jgi:hypothetical protein
MAGLVIAPELTERRFVQMKKNLAQFFGFRIAGCKTLSVNLTQGADEGVSVLVADFAVVVTVAIVETWLAHAALHRSFVLRTTASSRGDQMAILRRNTSKGDLIQRTLRSVDEQLLESLMIQKQKQVMNLIPI